MTWSTVVDDINAAALSIEDGFGEPVTLPSGDVVTGVFELFDPRVQDPSGSGVGRSMRISQQHNPMLMLLDADASGLAEGDDVGVRGSQWRITRIDPDGNGITELSLMPAPQVDAGDTFRRWR